MAKVAITEQYLEDIADAIRDKTGVNVTYYPAEMADAISTIASSGGITPSGTLSISENGTYNVTSYVSAEVEVASGGGGYVTQAADGSVTFSATSGPPTLISKSITQNGTYNPTSDNADGYSSVTVDVSGGGISGVVKGTLSIPTTINRSTMVDIINVSSIGFTPTQFIFYKNEDTKTNNAVYFASYSNFDSHYLRERAVYSRQDGFTLRGSAVTDWTTPSSGYLYYYSSTGAIQYSATSSYILEAGTYTWIAIE